MSNQMNSGIRPPAGRPQNWMPVMGLLVAATSLASLLQPAWGASFAPVIDQVQPKMVKIYGAGGFRGLEAYQSGFVISAEGHILTVWSYVLDADIITVTLDDGRKFEGELVGADPRLEIAVLKIDAEELDHFNLDAAVDLEAGNRVLAFSNLYGVATGDEPSSVLHGSVAAKTKLDARRGGYKTPYRGDVFILDAMTNNPGAAGGALTNRRGELAGILGKELKNSLNNTWLNYAMPIDQLAASVEDILAGRTRPLNLEEAERPEEAHSLAVLGITLVPDILDRTPPFVERIRPGSVAATAGIKADDLILFLDNRIIQSCQLLREQLAYIDRADEVMLTVQRGNDLLDFTLTAPETESP